MNQKKSGKADAPKTGRLGYPTIEALLDSEDFDRLNKSFGEGYNKLTALLDNKSAGLKTQKEARAAMKAYELTTDLLKELLQLKYAMQKESKKNEKK